MYPIESWGGPDDGERLLVAAASRLLIGAALAALVWLPWPRAAALVAERRWAEACLSALVLVALGVFPACGDPARGAACPLPSPAAPLRPPRPRTGEGPGVRAVPLAHWCRGVRWTPAAEGEVPASRACASLALALGAAAVVALSGGWASPVAFLLILPALSAAPAPGLAGAARVAGIILVGYLTAGAAGGVGALGGTTGAATVERGVTLAALGAAVLAMRAEAARRGALGRSMRALAGDWKEQLIALERARGELLAHVSHELLTPLAAIRAGAGLLAEVVGGAAVDGAGEGRRESPASPADADRAAQWRMARNVERNAVRLTVLVDDLLELARIEEARSELRPGWWPCADLLRRAAEAVSPLCEARRQQIEWEESPPGLVVWGDDRRIEQVLVNLLANANKYAGDRARIVARAIGDRGGVRLEVRDDGPGLPAGARDALFDRYYRGPGGPGRGSGLGLAIARALVDLHGGAIWAESEPGAGCRFCCWFPPPGAGDQALPESWRGGGA